MNVRQIKLHPGYYSETYANIMIGELIVLAFEVLLLAVFKTKQLYIQEAPHNEPWAANLNMKSQQSIKSSEPINNGQDQGTPVLPESLLPLPLMNLANLFIANAVALAVAFVTPHHSVLMVVLAWAHGAFFSATLLSVVHEKRIAYLFLLVCLLFDIAILVICLAEKILQIDLYNAARPLFSSE